MGFFHSHGEVTKFGLVSLIVGVLHFFEDMALLLAGRYTEIDLWVIILGGIIFSICITALFKRTWVKKHLL